DKPLISYFLLTFILAILVTCASLITSSSTAPRIALFVFWSTAAVLLLLFVAFQRALRLINPRDQIQMLVSASRKDMRRWRRRAERARPLMTASGVDDSHAGSPFDTPLAAYWMLNAGWSTTAQLAIRQLMSLAKRYA